MSDPWLKFFPTDWRADPALRMCSLAARGLWIEMIGLMHEAVPYGHLLMAGNSPTDAQLALLTGAPSDQIPDLVGELEAAGVFSRTSKGVIYSRRMTRTAKKVAIARKNGKNGGNPTFGKKTEIPPLDNQNAKGGVKAQKPEARSQIDDGGDACDADTLRGGILKAVGADPVSGLASPNGNLLGTRLDMEQVRMWRTDLGLDPETIVAVVKDPMSRKRDGPPSRFTYFDKAMQREAGRRNEPRLVPIKGGPHVSPQPSRQDMRAVAKSDALRDALDVAARYRRTSEADWV